MANVQVDTKPFGWGLWLVLAACWFATIQWRALMEPDEARYAEIPREMWTSGDWVTPRLNGIQYFEKPPLQYWATAALYSVFGIHEWTARLWALGLAFLTIPMTYAFARAVYGAPSFGIAAALALAANPFFVIVGQLNLLDSAFAFFMVAAVFAFLRSRDVSSINEEHRWILLTWISLACAVLSKGIVALVLPGATIVVYSVLTRDFSVWRRWHLGWGLPLFLLITAPWFWAVDARHPDFLTYFFIHEHFARFLTTVHERVEPWWYFLPLVILALAPWIARLSPSLRATWQGPMAGRFLMVWSGVVLVFFSVSQSKLPPYIMPMMAPLAVLLAAGISSKWGVVRQATWINGALIAFIAGGLVVFAAHKHSTIPLQMMVWSAFAVLASAAAVLIFRRIPASGVDSPRSVVFACCSILAWQALLMSYASLPPLRTAKPLVAAVRDFVGPDTILYSVSQYRQSIAPYLGRTLRLVAFRGELDYGLSHENVPYVRTLDEFLVEWQRSRDAVAFIAADVYEQLVKRGVSFHRLAADGRTVVVSRRDVEGAR